MACCGKAFVTPLFLVLDFFNLRVPIGCVWLVIIFYGTSSGHDSGDERGAGKGVEHDPWGHVRLTLLM